MKRHQVLFLISFVLIAIAVILSIVLTVQVRRLSYRADMPASSPGGASSVWITSTVRADGTPR